MHLTILDEILAETEAWVEDDVLGSQVAQFLGIQHETDFGRMTRSYLGRR